MGSRNTNNRLQLALFAEYFVSSNNVTPSSSSVTFVPAPFGLPSSLDSVASSSNISPELVALIAQTVQETMTTKRAQEQAVVSELAQAPPCSASNTSLGGVPTAFNTKPTYTRFFTIEKP